jgi:hypothetical protein
MPEKNWPNWSTGLRKSAVEIQRRRASAGYVKSRPRRALMYAIDYVPPTLLARADEVIE